VFRNLKSRSKHKDAPSHLEFTIRRGSADEVIQLPIKVAPIMFLFPLFAAPEYLRTTQSRSQGVTVVGTNNVLFGKNPLKLLKEMGATSITVRQTHHPVSFAKVIAKIALSTAYGEGAIGAIVDPRPLAGSILGHTDDIGRWVGNVHPIKAEKHRELHRISFAEDLRRGLLLADVHLFSDSQAPIYTVVLGHLK